MDMGKVRRWPALQLRCKQIAPAISDDSYHEGVLQVCDRMLACGNEAELVALRARMKSI